MANPGVTTLAALRTAVRQRADLVNSQFVTDAEVNGYINASAYELYDVLIQKFGDDYYASTYSLTTDGVNTKFALPADFYKMLGVDLVVTSAPNGVINVPRFSRMDRNHYGSAAVLSLINGRSNIRYRLQGSNLFLMPLPPSGLTVTLTYVPRWTALVNDTDTFDGVSGWEEYVVTDAAIKCLQKEESDVSALMAQKAALLARIESAADNRDAGNPQTTVDSLGANGMMGFGPGYGWGNGGW